ncbi:MAG TPA: hypothetical protein VJB38_03010 [Bacteroidota bacterium]|nr:hypothetical protein [Bacteroidota bacterium]
MGSSKIVFVGAVAVIIGIFGFGIKRAEKGSVEIATTHATQVLVKSLALQGLNRAVEDLPETASSAVDRTEEITTSEGTIGYSRSIIGMPAGQVKIISYGIANGQKATVTTVVTELPDGPIPPRDKSWRLWKQVSSVRIVTAYP